MTALNRKLLRDLGRMWAQSLAIALVMACGVMVLILSVGTYRSLEETRAAYYERYRFGDVFASVSRAPKSLAGEIAQIDGVAAVEARIVRAILLDIEGMAEPATGIAISLPAFGDIAVNSVFLREGRLPEPARANEVAVNANFAEAHRFGLGDSFEAIVSGSQLRLTIVGIVLSPEYVYAIGPGDLMPDDRRFGIVWMPEATLASLFDLGGAFNDLSLRLLPGANEAAVLEEVNALTAPYGGVGAHGRADQLSNAFLDGELIQLQGMAAIVLPIFLLVSAFLINMTLSRLIALEREQIGLLKAIGYGRTQVAWHYVKFVLAIAAFGILIGSLAGTWLGRQMTVLYAEFYAFPFLIFRTDPSTYLIAGGITVAAAVIGAIAAIRTAFSLPAAVAMQPPAPPVYKQFLGGAFERVRIFSALTVMALRHIVRHPVRSLLASLGIGFAVGLMAMGFGTIDSMNAMMDAIFFRTERQDASLAFSSPRSPGALAAVERLPGVLTAEPFLAMPVELANGHLTRQISIIGKQAATDLSRVVDLDLKPVVLPETGLALGDRVAEILDLRLGDTVQVSFLDGLRRTVDVPVTQIIQSYIGLMAYMDIDALARLAGTGPRLSGAYLAIDDAALDALYASVKETPAIGAIGLQSLAYQRFRATMEENIMISLSIYIILAGIIAFGVVYNSARIQLSERARELAILRVLGFRRREVSNVLLIEIGIVVAVAQPIGWVFGYFLGDLITSGLASDLFRVPFVVQLDTFAWSSLIVGAAALISALVVRRRVDRLDLIRVLKTRE